MKIAIDVRRLRDFGVGTYIRNLLTAMASVDGQNRFSLVIHPPTVNSFRNSLGIFK